MAYNSNIEPPTATVFSPLLLDPSIQPSRDRLHSIARASSSFIRTSPKMDSESYMFGPHRIDLKQVFYSTQLSYALVNLKPVVPGHILLSFHFNIKRFVDLSADETSDIWLTAQKVGQQLESYHKASSLTFTIQDGPQSGQTVPHVHIHILPRNSGDFEKNDKIYDAINEKEKELGQKLDLDEGRKDRNMEEMAEEAANYRKLFT
ncbi:unnamed protein product [Fraxinus pennsylvanica]|uniref:Bis(5'-adenosyl)-triphosphatase n=1 Tax=Fraxinus pennsylvanica TaxID=56036 RepID=A0AAD2E6E7_9LAMI|nr:unnamed protein product [Fraxinus pennsylvanica]